MKKAAWSKSTKRLSAVHGHPGRGGPRRSGTGLGKLAYHSGRGKSSPAGRNFRPGRVKAAPSAPRSAADGALVLALTRRVKLAHTAAGGTPVDNFQESQPGRNPAPGPRGARGGPARGSREARPTKRGAKPLQVGGGRGPLLDTRTLFRQGAQSHE